MVLSSSLWCSSCALCAGAGHMWIGALMHLLAAEPHSIAGLLFACQYLCGTILVTPYSIVWDWRVSRAGPMPFYWPSCSFTFCLLFSLSLLSLYGLVSWGWGIWTGRVLITLSSIKKQFRRQNAVGNMLVRKFSFAPIEAKIQLF